MSQLNCIGRHATTVATVDNFTNVTYHSTAVVRFNHEEIILRTGGWYTNTTKNRMNQTSNQFDLGFYVYQKNWDWFVTYKGETYPFYDRMIIDRISGAVTTTGGEDIEPVE